MTPNPAVNRTRRFMASTWRGSARSRYGRTGQSQGRSYQIKLVLPDGSELDVRIPPLDIDFTVVNGGFEILGTPVALPGVTGDAVPRMSCRLVNTQR